MIETETLIETDQFQAVVLEEENSRASCDLRKPPPARRADTWNHCWGVHLKLQIKGESETQVINMISSLHGCRHTRPRRHRPV